MLLEGEYKARSKAILSQSLEVGLCRLTKGKLSSHVKWASDVGTICLTGVRRMGGR